LVHAKEISQKPKLKIKKSKALEGYLITGLLQLRFFNFDF
jgi:hypothetical protein